MGGSQVGTGIHAMQPYRAVNDAPRQARLNPWKLQLSEHQRLIRCRETPRFLPLRGHMYGKNTVFMLSFCLTECIMFVFHQQA